MDISRNNFIYVLFLQLEYKSLLNGSKNNNKQTNNKQKQKKESYIIKKY